MASHSMATGPKSLNLNAEMTALLLGRPTEDGAANLQRALEEAMPPLTDSDPRDRCARDLVSAIGDLGNAE